jgi:hypothetical protein
MAENLKVKLFPSSEATKAGIFPPKDPSKFDEWRNSLDPDMMGFDGVEVGEDCNELDDKEGTN